MPSQTEIRQQVTDRLIAALEHDTIPWRRPWSNSPNAGRPANVVSKRAYSGINPLLLQVHAMTHGFTSKWWGTFDQIKELGGMVRRRPDHVTRGEWGCQIVFMKQVFKAVKDDRTGEERQDGFTVMRTFTVFNVDQVDGEALDRFRSMTDGGTSTSTPDFEPAERLVNALGVDLREGGDRAYYHRPLPEGSWPRHSAGDFIQVPARRQFSNEASYWETVLHEAAHAAEVRLGWDHNQEGYAMGELVAEIAACMTATQLGIPQGEGVENHAAYLRAWLGGMRSDPSFIFKASTQAGRVTDYLLGLVQADPQPVLVEG